MVGGLLERLKRHELASLAYLYLSNSKKIEDLINNYFIATELYLEKLFDEDYKKALKAFILTDKKASEVVENGKKFYLENLSRLTIGDFLTLLGETPKKLESIKDKKIKDFEEAYKEYVNAVKQYQEAGMKGDKNASREALEKMKRYERDAKIFEEILYLDNKRLEYKYHKIVIEEIIKTKLEKLKYLLEGKAFQEVFY
ncbi:MAG: hypothetical protein NZ889_00775 [Candidatus Pacearchaeota archaeon]|nr:hypothetical protein [Candidatus Pacearchaeota archaeon]